MTRVLIAGVGNVFFGDDGFGVTLSQQLERTQLAPDVRVWDVGIQALHLAFELLSPPELLVVLDAVRRGGAPGTLYLIDPEHEPGAVPGYTDAHATDLGTVFAMSSAMLENMGGALPRTRIVGCEAEQLEGMGLSAAVQLALEPAAAMVQRLLQEEESHATG